MNDLTQHTDFSHKQSQKLQWAFLVLGLFFVSLLAMSKNIEIQALEHFESLEKVEAPLVVVPTLDSTLLELPKREFRITKKPISCEVFRQFTQETGYLTWRERHGHWPNWEYSNEKEHAAPDVSPSWIQNPDAPVYWITRSDAEAFCAWLAQAQGLHRADDGIHPPWTQMGYRLPTVEELTLRNSKEETNSEIWEWTSNTLADFSANTEENNRNPQNRKYLTLWHPTEKPQHRRPRDLADPELAPATFRVAETVNINII